MGSSLRRTVPEFTGNFKSLLMKMNGSREIAQQVVDVAQVATGPALGRAISDFHHQAHVLLVVLDGFFEERLDLLGEFAGVLV